MAYDGVLPVGMVRVIGDGGMSFYIKDFAIIPAYQSKGVGRLLIEKHFTKKWDLKQDLVNGMVRECSR